MKAIFDYDETTGALTNTKGVQVIMLGMTPEKFMSSSIVLELVKQGLTTDDILKLKNNALL